MIVAIDPLQMWHFVSDALEEQLLLCRGGVLR
jgi:hypothetical protein